MKTITLKKNEVNALNILLSRHIDSLQNDINNYKKTFEVDSEFSITEKTIPENNAIIEVMETIKKVYTDIYFKTLLKEEKTASEEIAEISTKILREEDKKNSKIKLLNFFSDPGHGWLRISKKELCKLDIQDNISNCSYMKGDFAYLEEDRDATIYINELKNRGFEFKFVEHHTDRTSIIRSYESYKSYNQIKNEVEKLHLKNLISKNLKKVGG